MRSEEWDVWRTSIFRIAAVLAVSTNLLLIYLIIFHSPKRLGLYKCLMVFICVFEILYEALNWMTDPDIFTDQSAFIVIINYNKTPFPKSVTMAIDLAYCAFFGTSLATFSVHFVYRYFVVLGIKEWIITSARNLIFWLSAPLVFGACWFINDIIFFTRTFHFSTDDFLEDFLRDQIPKITGASLDDVGVVGSYFFPTNRNQVTVFNWKALYGMIVFLIMTALTLLTMIFFGYKTFRKLNESVGQKSENYKNVQTQLLYALISQTVIPLLLMHIPLGFCIILPLFNSSRKIFGEILVFSVAIYPVLDPMPNMFLIRNYRGAIFNNYSKYRQLNTVPKGLEDSKYSSFQNTDVFINWDSWSCCSACCCPKSVCGQFSTSDNCANVKSVKTRTGSYMIRRRGDTGNAELEALFSQKNEIKLADAMQIDAIKTNLESSRVALTQKLKVSVDTQSVFQIESCSEDIQKTDCWELATCLFGNSDMLPAKEMALIEEKDVCENASIFVLRDAYNILSLEPEQLYRLQIDRSIGDGNILDAMFLFDGKQVEQLKHLKDCFRQPKRVFEHPNGQDLILRLTSVQLAKNPKIIINLNYQDPTQLEIVVDIVLRTKIKVEKSAKKDTLFSTILISSLAACTLILLALSLFFLRP